MNAKIVVLYAARSLGIFALFRLLTARFTRILCYHGGSVGDEHLFNPKLFCRPGLLLRRLEWLKRKGFSPSTLDALVQSGMSGTQQGIPLIVTLDDGWYSSAKDLLPVLAKFNFKPTLYLATKVFCNGNPVIDVCLRYILWKSPLKEINIVGVAFELDGIYALTQSADRERLCSAAQAWLTPFESDGVAIRAQLEHFAALLNVSAAALDLVSRRFDYMGVDELLCAVRGGCTIELHGHAHNYVMGDPKRNRIDIEACRTEILKLGVPTPRHYCYPSGSFDKEASTMLASINIKTATTCIPGLVFDVSESKSYFLPRLLDGADVSMIEFEAEMSGVLSFLRRIAGRST